MRRRSPATWLAAALMLAAVWGCTDGRRQARLIVGTVDTARVLQSNPRYEEYARLYLEERVKAMHAALEKLPPEALQQGLRKGMAEIDPALRQEVVKAERELDERWAKITADYVTRGHAAILRAAREICAEKGIDMVLIDSRLYPTVEYGAIDITEDIMRKLSEPEGAPAPQEERS